MTLPSPPARTGSPLGLHRVLEPAGVLPQAAWRLDPSPQLWPDEVRIRVQRLNLDAASFRQLREAAGGDPAAMKSAVLEIVSSRGKMQNPVTGSGGMLTGVVAEVGPQSPLGLKPGDVIATLVSLSLTPLELTDGLASWDGRSEQVPCDGHAILFGRSIAARIPDDLPAPLALAVLDVCGAPALTGRVVAAAARRLAGDPGRAAPGRTASSPMAGRIASALMRAGRPAGRSSRSWAPPARAAACRPPRRGTPAPAASSGSSPTRPRLSCSAPPGPRTAGPAWPTRSSSPTRATRSRCPPRSGKPAARPT